jgi:general L-amino acid transport system ATP-binding protein
VPQQQQISEPQPSSGTDVAISLDRVNKWFGAFHVLRDVSLTIRRGERFVVCGPSGSGKSTMIRCVNALEEHQQGRIVVNDIELTRDVRTVERIRREVGMVFQQYRRTSIRGNSPAVSSSASPSPARCA